MSLEAKIEALALAVERLAAVMSGGSAAPIAPMPPPPPPPTFAPQAPSAMPPPVAPMPPPMPPPPTFAPQAPSAIPSTAPFTDAQGLMNYTMSVFSTLGPEKGSLIQNVLEKLGHRNINELRPEEYNAYFQHLEKLQTS